jgi:hypothetical protein
LEIGARHRYNHSWACPTNRFLPLGNARPLSNVSQGTLHTQGIILETLTDLQRISVMTLIITALAGANYWSLAVFWPLECQTLYGPDAMKVALYVLPFLYSITFGMILVNWGLSLFHGKNRELLTLSSVIMTVGIACLAIVNQYNPSVGIGLSFLAGLGTGGILRISPFVLEY